MISFSTSLLNRYFDFSFDSLHLEKFLFFVHFSEEDHEGILNLFPKAKFEYIANAGHWVHAEEPHKLLGIVVDFLKSHGSKQK